MLDLEHFDASSRLIERVSMRKSAERATRRGQTTARAGMVHVTGRFSSPFPVHRFLLKDVRSERWSHFQATRLAGKEEVVVPRSRFVRFARSRYIYICIYIYTLLFVERSPRSGPAAGCTNSLGSGRYTKKPFRNEGFHFRATRIVSVFFTPSDKNRPIGIVEATYPIVDK